MEKRQIAAECNQHFITILRKQEWGGKKEVGARKVNYVRLFDRKLLNTNRQKKHILKQGRKSQVTSLCVFKTPKANSENSSLNKSYLI